MALATATAGCANCPCLWLWIQLLGKLLRLHCSCVLASNYLFLCWQIENGLEGLLMEKGNVGANHAVGINVVKAEREQKRKGGVAASTGAAIESKSEPDQELN